MSDIKGWVHSVETFGTLDGRGIRYVLFLSGCSLGCAFCHNPDTWKRGGREMSVAEVLADYQRYRPFYDASNGGITVSGGEPMEQAAFVGALFAACQAAGIHTTLDTSGNWTAGAAQAVLPYTDAVLFSLKGAREETYRSLTKGGDYQATLLHLKEAVLASDVTLRFVVIPGLTDGEVESEMLAKIVLALPRPVAVQLLPYHTMGVEKWRILGMDYPLEGILPASKEIVSQVALRLSKRGVALST